MEKIKFIRIGPNKSAAVESLDNKYWLLSIFIDTYRLKIVVKNKIEELETILSGKKTFEEVAKQYGGQYNIGHNCGHCICTKDTAYFISDNTNVYQSFEMPLQELIDFFKQWKKFIKN